VATAAAGTGAQPLRMVQVTDTHLYADPDGRLLGLNTRYSLEQVIDLVRSERPPDLVVASGDLTHDGSAQAYHHVQEAFRRIAAPVYCLPGNHDETTTLHSCMNRAPFYSERQAQLGNWRMIFLDSTQAGSEGGHLAGSELDALDALLAANPEQYTLVWLHHQPVPAGSRWLDSMAVDNPGDLFAVTDRYSGVRAIVWGHIHQHFAQQRKGVRLLATPSTCIQFLPGSERFALDPVPPGYRWFDLHADGTFTTGVQRLQEIPGEIDPDARGY